MNERIKELALELVEHCDWNPPHDPEYYTFAADDLEKFAELIVRDCANWIESCVDDFGGEKIDDRFYWSEQLLKHFGVKK